MHGIEAGPSLGCNLDDRLGRNFDKVRRVLRNDRALVLIFGSERRDFLILPRASLQPFGREALLDQYIEAAKGKTNG